MLGSHPRAVLILFLGPAMHNTYVRSLLPKLSVRICKQFHHVSSPPRKLSKYPKCLSLINRLLLLNLNLLNLFFVRIADLTIHQERLLGRE